ncbi:hypothetical protein [Cellulosimicrobium sp. CUA-896]|uniref:hypothetical protein n=1 Tax=Cellulosimicrobium sp. CUA-896 TaxID=1517881 RepID=UPI00096464A1|nr:hypothetical protein [Cellulosimicrobium sp. CUA-896]OLT45532.1 hypothetical protein BJF88_05730 [Cellulosimicrobium sp. CUA-896]
MSDTSPRPAADAEAWRRQRTEAAEHQQRELDRRRAAESTAARALVADFVAAARERGVAPEPLRARAFTGGATYRTDVEGWYLRRNRSVAVGTDGEFYVLGVPASLVARLRGARLTPSDPPLVLGKGGRDGESVDLADALAGVLDRP